jgi:hypothetical protein
MTSISSSFISYNTNTLRGNTGPTGASGPTGSDGAQGNAGGTQAGNTGENGIYVKSLNISSSTNSLGCTLNYILGYLTDTSTTSGEISGAEIFRGSLLLSYEGVSYQGSTLGVNICKGLSFDTSGITKQAIFNFKDIISSSVAISVTSDSNFIYINATGGQSTYSSTNNGLAYKATANVTTTNPNTIGLGFSFDSNFGITSGHYLYINGLTGSTNSIIVDRKVITIPKNSTDLQYLDLSNRGVFNIKTPIGFAGFTGIAGTSGATGTILSATLIFDSEDVWHFPQNIFFRNKQNYLTPGTTIIGVHSVDYGVTWRADIFGRGYPTGTNVLKNSQLNRWPINIMGATIRQRIIPGSPFVFECTDYDICPKDSGAIASPFEFKPLQLCTSGLTHCCIKGKQQLVPEHLCRKYKGRMFSSSSTVECFDPCGTNDAGTTGSCCISGTCNKRYTISECANQGGVFATGGTCGSSCISGLVASVSGPLGACCNINLTQNCSYISQPECDFLGGVFTSGVSCADVNCSTITNFNPTINTQDIPDITENSVTKNIRLDLGGGNFDCITIIGTPEYLSQFKEC